MKIGIDVGGVITVTDTDEAGAIMFTDRYLEVGRHENSFEVIKRLVEVHGRENVYIVSKCGVNVQLKTMHWLDHHKFFDFTNFQEKNVIYCRHRSEKAHFIDWFKINYFIDDRYTVLKHMTDLKCVYNLFLFQPQEDELKLFYNDAGKIIVTKDWKHIERELCE